MAAEFTGNFANMGNNRTEGKKVHQPQKEKKKLKKAKQKLQRDLLAEKRKNSNLKRVYREKCKRKEAEFERDMLQRQLNLFEQIFRSALKPSDSMKSPAAFIDADWKDAEEEKS